MNLNLLLQNIGLNSKEAHLYLTLLGLGKATAFVLAKESGVKRSSVYVLLEKLPRQGLITTTQTKKVAFFSALSPRSLYALHKAKEEQLKAALPELEALEGSAQEKPQFRVYEGFDGVHSVYYEMIEHYRRGGDIQFFAKLEPIMKAYGKVLDILKAEIKKPGPNKGRLKDLMTEGRFEKSFYEEMKNSANYEIRFVPSQFGQINNDIVIYGNKLAIISGKTRIFATVIESDEVAESFRTMHAMAWAAAKKPVA